METKRFRVKREFCTYEGYRLFLFEHGNYVGKIPEECKGIQKNDKVEVRFNGIHWTITDKEGNIYPIYNCSIPKPNVLR